MELETVLYRVEGNVGIVSLNRTKALHAMSKQIFVDLLTFAGHFFFLFCHKQSLFLINF